MGISWSSGSASRTRPSGTTCSQAPITRVPGRVLTASVRRETLVPAGIVLASSRDAGLVELPVQVNQGDMAQGLRPGDSVRVLAAYTEGARRGRAVVLLPSAEVVQVLQDPAGLAGTGQERGVQLRMPSDRAPDVVAAIATVRIFIVKAPGPAAEPAATGTPDPDGSGSIVPDLDESTAPDPAGPAWEAGLVQAVLNPAPIFPYTDCQEAQVSRGKKGAGGADGDSSSHLHQDQPGQEGAAGRPAPGATLPGLLCRPGLDRGRDLYR
jgi:hypothetical protein